MAHIDFKKAFIYSAIVAGLASSPAYAKYKAVGENMGDQTVVAGTTQVIDYKKGANFLFGKYGTFGKLTLKDYLDFIKAFKIDRDETFRENLGIKTDKDRKNVLAMPALTKQEFARQEMTTTGKVVPKKTLAGISEGEKDWTVEYYPAAGLASASVTLRSVYDKAATLSADAYSALRDYANTANESGVASDAEKKTVAVTAVMLYGVDQSLVPQYFAAAENLAGLCRNQPNEYRKVMDRLAAMIDAKTSAIYSKNVEAQLPIQKTSRNISNALGEIFRLGAEDMYRLNRLSLMDRNVYINNYPPYEIRQKVSGWQQNLLEGRMESWQRFQPIYPFPTRIYLPIAGSMPKSAIGVDIRGGGGMQYANIWNYWSQSWAGNVGTSIINYVSPSHRVSGAHGNLPVTLISPMGISGLVDKIRAAFVETEAPSYGLKAVGAGLYSTGSKETGAGGVASYATKSGGLAGGFNVSPENELDFAGLNMVAIPLVPGKAAETVDLKTAISSYDSGSSALKGSIKAAWKSAYKQSNEPTDKMVEDAMERTYYNQKNSPADMAFWKGINKVVKGPVLAENPVRAAIEDFTVGWEKTAYETKEALLQSISAIYGKNPKNIILLASSSANETNQWAAGRAYLITKDAQVFELAAGSSSFNKMLNYIAGYGSDEALLPKTYAWNVENQLKKGGAVIALDLGTVPILFQFQDYPGVGSNSKLVTWTAAGGTTRAKKGGETEIHEISLPGTLYNIGSRGEVTSQHANYALRHFEDKKRWEFDAGITAGKSTLGLERKAFQGTGFLMKWEQGDMDKRASILQRGFGLSMQRLGGQALQLADNFAEDVNSLYRISGTLYGSKSPAGSDMIVGGLLHVVEQLRGEVGNDRYDATLFRFVGFLRGLKNCGMLDVTRSSWIDRMLGDFDDMRRSSGQNPYATEALMDEFQRKYLGNVRALIDNYYLGVQLDSDFSVEFSMQAKESRGDDWTGQMVERGAGRMLYTWDGGFVRGYCQMPMLDYLSPIEGLVGAGAGFDLFKSVWLPRLAADAGVVTVSEKQRVSGFVQAGAEVYSDILEDAAAYRRLVSDETLALEGKFSEIPKKAREEILGNLKNITKGKKADQEMKDAIFIIEMGKDAKDVSSVPKEVNRAVKAWFADEKAELQKKFNGHTRVYAGASLYGLGHGQFYGDIGAFVEYADRLKAYVIVAPRKEVSVYLGADYDFDRSLSLGVIAGASPKGLSGGLSFSVPVTIAGHEGILRAYGVRTTLGVLPYSPPFSFAYEYSTRNDWVYGLVWTWGLNPLKPTQTREKQQRFGR
jgi:hypothetical protein